VHLGTKLVHLTNNVGHTSLVAHEGSKVAWFRLVILREGLDLSSISSRSLSWEETQRTVSWSSKLSVRHNDIFFW
jgi:hypothetical protein